MASPIIIEDGEPIWRTHKKIRVWTDNTSRGDKNRYKGVGVCSRCGERKRVILTRNPEREDKPICEKCEYERLMELIDELD